MTSLALARCCFHVTYAACLFKPSCHYNSLHQIHNKGRGNKGHLGFTHGSLTSISYFEEKKKEMKEDEKEKALNLEAQRQMKRWTLLCTELQSGTKSQQQETWRKTERNQFA